MIAVPQHSSSVVGARLPESHCFAAVHAKLANSELLRAEAACDALSKILRRLLMQAPEKSLAPARHRSSSDVGSVQPLLGECHQP